MASLAAQRLKCLPAMQETWVRSLGREDPMVGPYELSILYIVVCMCQPQSPDLFLLPLHLLPPPITISLFSISATLFLFCK